MLLLLFASVASWLIIFRKRSVLGRAEREAGAVRGTLLVRRGTVQIYAGATERNRDVGGLEAIFEAGFREFNRARQRRGGDSRAQLEGAQRAMRATASREARRTRAQPRVPRQRRFHQPLRRPVRHGVGDHGLVPGPGEREGDDSDRRARYFRGAGRDRDGPVRGDPGGVGLQPLRDQVDRISTRYDAFSEEFSSILQRQAHVEE